MAKEARFWRNVALIALAHLLIVAGLIYWNRYGRVPEKASIVWMAGGAEGGAQAGSAAIPGPAASESAPPLAEAPPPKIEQKDEQEQEDHPVLTSVESNIHLPRPTAVPSATASPTPKPMATPKIKISPTPKPEPSRKPKPKPKATPKPKPKPPTKKLVLAKASTKPKIKSTPGPKKENEQESEEIAEKKRIAKAALAKNQEGDGESDAGEKPVRKAAAAGKSSGSGDSGDSNGAGGGGKSASDFGWYGSMLHDRFHSEWIQPTTTVASSAKISTLVQIRIEKDGRVSSFEIIKPSGNVLVDESVAAIAKHVPQVDPLPDGLGKSGHYDVRINFELNSEQ